MGKIRKSKRKHDYPQSGWPWIHRQRYLKENPDGEFYWGWKVRFKKPKPKLGGWPGVWRARYLKENPDGEFYWGVKARTPRYRTGTFYCPAPWETVECRTCGIERPRTDFRESTTPGKVYPGKCRSCIAFEKTPNPKPQEEINKAVSEALLRYWDKRGRPTDKIQGMDWRQKLPDKKRDLPSSYPVWE